MEEYDENIKVVHEDLVNTVEKEDTEENIELEETELENLDENDKDQKAKKVKKVKKSKKERKTIVLSLGTATLLLVSVITAILFITIAFGMITIRKMKKNNSLEIKNMINSSKSTIIQIEKEM